MLEIHHDWGQVVPTIFPNSYTSVWIVFVSKHSCNAEASSQQSIGSHSRTSEGVSISLWTTWLRVTSPAPGDWWRKGSIKPSCYSSSSSSSTTPNQTTSPDKMAVRLFPQASTDFLERTFKAEWPSSPSPVFSAPNQQLISLHFAHPDGFIITPLPCYMRRGDYNLNWVLLIPKLPEHKRTRRTSTQSPRTRSSL